MPSDTDLLSAADAAQRSYWQGSDKSKLNLRECMTELRLIVEAEKKRRAKEDTTRIVKPKDHEHD